MILRNKWYMIDIHSHILSGVDDGAKNFERSVDMLDMAVADGITTLFATPHYSKTLPAVLENTFNRLQPLAAERGITLIKGSEIDYVHLVDTRPLITLGNSNFVLIDMRQPFLEMSCENVLDSVQRDKYRIIIAHPERLFMERDLKSVKRLAEIDCVFQLNASSVVGAHGTGAQKMAFKIIEAGFAHYIGSDAHGKQRGFYLSAAREIITKKYGKPVAELLFEENARQLLQNQDPFRVVVKARKWYHFFR